MTFKRPLIIPNELDDYCNSPLMNAMQFTIKTLHGCGNACWQLKPCCGLLGHGVSGLIGRP
eukprot:11225388-Lingulodinium_polyedra.AAC.1